MSEFNSTDIRRLDFGLLLVLTEAVRQKKLAGVADTLGLTQSAVSHSVSRLRAIFNDELLIRRPHGVEPTVRAYELAALAETLLSTANTMLSNDQAFDPQNADRTLRLVTWDQELRALAPALHSQLGRVQISSQLLDRRMTIDALRRGAVDLAIGIFGRVPKMLHRAILWRDRFVTIAAASHPRLEPGKVLTLDQFCAERHVLTTLTGSSRGRIDESLSAIGRSRTVSVAAAQFLTSLELVASTDIISTVPANIAEKFASRFALSIFETPIDTPELAYEGLWHARADHDPAIKWFVDLLADGNEITMKNTPSG
ncbi:MAG: LysR family transcriptional regulator [Pseudomonadota bacterium]